MLNLLIAIMGGSYENVEGRAYNEGLKARAQSTEGRARALLNYGNL